MVPLPGQRWGPLSMTSLTLWLLWSLKSAGVVVSFVHRLDRCEPIAIPRCHAMPYNMTRMPNLLHHSTQENARLTFDQFQVLLDQNCSDVLLFFLCAMYAPICTVAFQPEPIPPCRALCQRARAGCQPLMNSYNASWPEALNCSKLPRYERGVCISPEAIVAPGVTSKRCKCKKRKKRVKKMFRKHKYDYAIRAVVTRRKRVDSKTLAVKVQVEEVLYCSKVKFPRSNHVTLWTNSTCACPRLRPGRRYLLAGHEDAIHGRFLLTPSALAATWRDKWAARVKHWRRKALKSKSRVSSDGKGDNSLTTISAPPPSRKSQRLRGKKRRKQGKSRSRSRAPSWRRRSRQRGQQDRRTLLTNKNLTRR